MAARSQILSFVLSCTPMLLSGQTLSGQTKSQRDSLEGLRINNQYAVAASGVWSIDGEYKGTNGEYFKLSGSFAYVASTPTSVDKGDAAVLSMYLEPMAGGSARWLGARMACEADIVKDTARCAANSGAQSLLELNFMFKEVPWRGKKIEGTIEEPEAKDPDKRYSGRSSPRGKFTLVPP